MSASPLIENGFALDDTSSDIYTRLESQMSSFNRSDQARNELMHRLLRDNVRLHEQLAELQDDLDSEKKSRRENQEIARKMKVECQRMTSKSEHDPFALVLIDGDGCIFQDHFLKAAAEGGADAAQHLKQEVAQLLSSKNIGPHCNVIVQIYLSLEDLSRKLASVGLLQTHADMKSFVHAFCNSQSLFSIIDVGKGKERADHKMRGMFKLFVNNSHCKHIIFGGCHDNGYITTTLEEYRKDLNVAPRLTLLETTPATPHYHTLGLDIVRFPSVFRETELPTRYSPTQHFAVPNVPTPTAMSAAANAFVPASSNVFSPSPGPGESPRNPTPPSLVHSPVGDAKPLAHLPNGTTTPVNRTYATAGGPAENRNISIAPATKTIRKYIVQNANLQRLDPPISKHTPEAEARFKARFIRVGKLCNNFHLRGNCPAEASCDYSHGEALTEGERNVFRQKVRTTRCGRGSWCEDVDCYLGHVCQFDKTPAGCTMPNCRFADTHGMDTTPYMRVYDDGEVVPFRG